MPISFCKFHGYENDYIVIEQTAVDGPSLPELAKAICHRHTGAGADGIAVVRRLDETDADFGCEIVNPDGSIAGFSGNGTRCAVAYLHYSGRWTDSDLRLRTLSGVKQYHLLASEGPGHYTFRAEIGRPKFASDEIPVAVEQRLETVVDRQLTAGGKSVTYSAVNVGNPVACVFVDDFELDWRGIGREIERHSEFPDRANVVFARVIAADAIELRIWERGAGETAASGTCSSAAAVLCALTGRTGRHVTVSSPGGTADFLWRDDDDEMVLTGTAVLAYCGTWL